MQTPPIANLEKSDLQLVIGAVSQRDRHKLEKLLDPKGAWSAVKRRIICTPILGNNGLSFWVMVLEGSPPKGALILQAGWGRRLDTTAYAQAAHVIFIDAQGRARGRFVAQATRTLLNDLLDQIDDPALALPPHAVQIASDGAITAYRR